MISRFITTIYNLYPEATAEDIADAVWLASHIGTSETSDMVQSEDDDANPEERTSWASRDATRSSSQPGTRRSGSTKTSGETDSHAHLLAAQTGQDRPGGLPFRTPAASALPGSLSIGRSLRPFMRRVPSRTKFTLDEQSTAQRIAEERLWIPVLNPALTHWFEVALIIDASTSMVVWRQTIAELQLVLERQGAFRDVRTWRLVADTNGERKIWIYSDTGVADNKLQGRSPGELIDPTGQRLFLVLTDCVSLAWRSGVMARVLEIWGKSSPVAIVQMLPQRLWSRTALRNTTPVQLKAPYPGASNKHLQIVSRKYMYDQVPSDGICVPIVTLEPEALAVWGHAVTSIGGTSIPGFVFDRQIVVTKQITITPQRQEEISTSISAEKRVQRFRATASPIAKRLAGLVAAAPVSLPVIRLIQQTMLPEARQVHVAEFFLSGLLEEVVSDEEDVHPDYVQYDFVEGVRELLLKSIPTDMSMHVLRIVSNFIEKHQDQSLNFYALLLDPSSETALSITEKNRPFATVTAKALQKLGGEYSSLATRIEKRLSESPRMNDDGEEILIQPISMQRQYVSEREQDQISTGHREPVFGTTRQDEVGSLLSGTRTSSEWRQYGFDEMTYQTFIRRLEQGFIITILIEMKGGYSGARTSLVQIEPRDPRNAIVEKGKYILKVCFAEDAEREKQKHAKAKENDILGEYVPNLVAFISYDGIPLVGILYQISREELLTRTTLQGMLEQRQTSQKRHDILIKEIEELANIILRWNFEVVTSRTSDLLGSMLRGVAKERLTELEKRLKGICRHTDRSRIDLTPLAGLMYNPVYFLSNRGAYEDTMLRQMPYLIPIGMLHGDLHPGNVIISREDRVKDSSYIIDFASSRHGNAFFDLAYFEISIILNSRGSFHRMLDLNNWWDLDQHLLSAPLPSGRKLQGGNWEDLQRVLPIRRALDARIKQDGRQSRDDYWVAYLAASVEAALEIASKVYRDRSLQRVAFLTAVSRFHHLITLLKAIKTPLPGPIATIHWPGKEPFLQGEKKQEEVATTSTASSLVHKERAKLALIWPMEITRRTELYDPWGIVDGIWSTLTGISDQGVLLIGERRFGKSSFFNCVIRLFPTRKGNIRAIRLDTLGFSHSARSFAIELLRKVSQSVGLQDSLVFDSTSGDFDIDSFLLACQEMINKKKGMRFVVCVDEVDSILASASSSQDALAILQILSKLLTHPDLPVRLLLTAYDIESMRNYSAGIGFLDNLGIWRIPLCTESEMREFIERFEVPIKFEENALRLIFYYSGGQIYFVKLIIKLVVDAIKTQTGMIDGKKIVSAQIVDDLIQSVITPGLTTSFSISNIHEIVFPTMSNTYEILFSENERQFMLLLTEAGGVLPASSLEVSEIQLANIANILYQRGYVAKTVTEEGEEFSWRIGIWQLFLENYYQLRYHK